MISVVTILKEIGEQIKKLEAQIESLYQEFKVKIDEADEKLEKIDPEKIHPEVVDAYLDLYVEEIHLYNKDKKRRRKYENKLFHSWNDLRLKNYEEFKEIANYLGFNLAYFLTDFGFYPETITEETRCSYLCKFCAPLNPQILKKGVLEEYGYEDRGNGEIVFTGKIPNFEDTTD